MQDSSGALIAQLRHYMSRGWALVPLHDVSSGTCSCRAGAECRSAGKHPRSGDAWQVIENLVRTEVQLLEAVGRWPSSNWGLATGLISGAPGGVWALDYDPHAVLPGDREAVDRILSMLEYVLTFKTQTGSGGNHWVFAAPVDFMPTNGTGSLPSGFDVRGASKGRPTGGQIVLPPSVSAKGGYCILLDAPAVAAPDELLALLRPKPRPEVVGTDALLAVTSGRGASYAQQALRNIDQELRSAQVRRNLTCFAAACRIVEFVNAGWVLEEHGWALWFAAGKAHPDLSVYVPDIELERVWASAVRKVGDGMAVLPASAWGGDGIFPSYAPGAVPLLGGGPGADMGQYQYPQVYAQPVDNARTASDSAGQSPDSDPVSALLGELLDVSALRNITPPQPLINGVLDLDTTAWLIGESGSYKSFVALDFAAHVGLGRPWRGHDVRQGDVIYIVAEGARGMRLRVDAWEREHGPMKGVWFLPRPVQVKDVRAWTILAEACRRLRPALVVIDTQARVTLGLEENSNSDMGHYVAAVDAVRTATGACVLTVHHLGRNGKNARGASALDGAQDAELRIEKTGQYAIKLIMDKQKDQAESEPIVMRLKRSEGGTDATTGRDLSSLAVDHLEVPLLGEPYSAQDVGRRRALALFRLVHDLLPYGGEGLQRSEIKKLFFALPEIAALSGTDARDKAWIRAWSLLLSRGRVMRYGSSQRFAVYPPPDGGADGMITANTGGPDDAPPEGWSLMTVSDNRDLPKGS